jgi:hypothetical protein
VFSILIVDAKKAGAKRVFVFCEDYRIV